MPLTRCQYKMPGDINLQMAWNPHKAITVENLSLVIFSTVVLF